MGLSKKGLEGCYFLPSDVYFLVVKSCCFRRSLKKFDTTLTIDICLFFFLSFYSIKETTLTPKIILKMTKKKKYGKDVFQMNRASSLHSRRGAHKGSRSPDAASRFSIATRLKLENLQRWAAPPPTSGSVWKFHPKWPVHVIGAWYRSITINIWLLGGFSYPVQPIAVFHMITCRCVVRVAVSMCWWVIATSILIRLKMTTWHPRTRIGIWEGHV